MSTIPAAQFELIESIVNKLAPKAQEDARSFFQSIAQSVAQIQSAQGISPGAKAATVATPPQPSLSVSGGNGSYSLAIAPPTLATPATLWYRISYSAIKGFTSGVTTMGPTTSTSIVLNLPNQDLFFQVEASFTQSGPWTAAVSASNSATSSGLVSSSAVSSGGAFNQTNLGVVTSMAIGATAAVQVQGAGGPLTSMPTLKGAAQSVLPAATIIGVPPGSSQFVGHDGDGYVLRPTLGALLSDDFTPVAKVSVVGTGEPVLPTIAPIISGGHIIGYNVTDGGNGASAPYTITITDGPGTGATAGAQTIAAGVLISVAPGNPGQDYDGSTAVVASGGVFPGAPGGGTAQAGNGGRLTNV